MKRWWDADRGWLRVAKHDDEASENGTLVEQFVLSADAAAAPNDLESGDQDFYVYPEDSCQQCFRSLHRRFEPHFDDGALHGCADSLCHNHCSRELEKFDKIDEATNESRGMQRSQRKVAFHEKIHVVCFHEEEICETVLHIEQCEMWLRNVWHLHGQIMAWPHVISYLTSAFFHEARSIEHVQQGMEGPNDRWGNVFPSSSCDAPTKRQSDLAKGESEELGQWHLAMQSWKEQERVVNGRVVITWFLARGRAHVCVQHRQVRIVEGMTASEFQQVCRATWWDLIEEDDLEFHFVHPKPPGSPSTLAHVIILQGNCLYYNAVLYHGESFPALRRQRAVLYREGITVQQFYVEAHHPEACRIRNARCFIQFEMENQHTLLCDEDLMHVPIATLVKGTIRVSEDEEEVEGTAVESDEENSQTTTDAPEDQMDDISSQSDDMEGWSSLEDPRGFSWSWEGQHHIEMPFENDECSWMSASPVRWQIEHPDPYPWHTEPLFVDDEQEEEEIDTVFGEQHLQQLQEYVDQALTGLENEDTTWQAITYGIGLLDLGRRDFPFHPWNLQQLPQLVQQAWWDHAQYGALTIFFVFPQPGEAPNTVTLLVSVASPDDLNPDVRNLLITQKGDKKAGLRPVSYGAKVLTGSTSRELLVQLGLHKKCKPFTMRNCEVRLGTEVMQDDVRYNFDHGLWCCPAIGHLPEYVVANMERVDQMEAFYLQVEDFFILRPEETSIVCHVHGVSPENRPMGHRVLVVRRDELQGHDWIERMWQLWPFDHPYSPITFCPYAVPDMRECTDMIFHFAVDYGSQDGVTVLVQQEIQVADEVPKGKKGAHEFWAIVMPHVEITDDNMEVLDKSPFWKRYADKQGLRLHMYVNGERYHDVPGQWNDGDVLTLKLNVGRPEHVLSILLRDGLDLDPLMDEVVTEQTSFLQVGVVRQQVNAYERGFDEICLGVRKQCEQAMQDKEVERMQERCSDCDDSDLLNKDLQDGDALLRPCQEDNSDLLDGWSKQRLQSPVQESNDAMLESLKSDLQVLFTEGWKGLNRDFALIPYLHPYAAIASQQVKLDVNCHNVFHIFTDGSCKRHNAAWAFVVLCECRTPTHSNFVRVGYAAGMVDDAIGPVRMTATDAEATAIIAGVEYLLACPTIQNAEIFFHYDALAVGHGACGLQNVVQHVDTFSDRQHAARIMMSILQQSAGAVTGLHVKAHQGHPWNECADSIAGLVRQGWQPMVQTEFRSGRLLSHQLREWAWIEAMPDSQMPSLDTVLNNSQADPNEGWFDPTLSPEASKWEQGKKGRSMKDDQPQRCRVHRLRFATANVETMEYNGDSDCGSIKANELLRQCQLEHIHICAIQESRARLSRIVTNEPFTRFVAKGCNGQAGVELWLNGEELAKIFHCDFQPEKDVCVWHSSERILAARCQMGTSALEIVVFYAPQRGRTMQEQEHWWRHFKSVLEKRDKRAHLFMLGDGNCSVGSCSGDEIGHLAADMEDEGGEFLREICREQKLMIPSTFDCWHGGQTHTFTSANGGRSRIDYILMPQELGASVVRSFVHQDFDLMNGDRDHFPLCLESDIKVGEKDVVRRFNRSPLYHRAEAMKKHQNAAMQDILVNCPSVDWSVDVNDHWNWVRHHLQQKIKNIFPCQKRQQRQLYFSNEAWNVLCSRKEIRKQYRALQREKRILMLRAIWQAWKGNMQDCEAEETLRMPLHFLRCQEAVTFEARIKIDHDFKCIKRRDWRQWIKQQLVDKVEKAKGVRSAELFKILRPKQMIARSTGKLIRQLPGLCGEDGQWKNNRDAIALEWQTQFGTIENAEEVTAVELLQRSVSRHEGCWQASDLLSIPSLYHLESAIRALQAAKATGLDGLGAEVLQADPVVAAKKLYPILLKAAVRGQGVMEFAGGWLLPLFKGRGNPQNMAGYRAILLESVVSRAFSKAWRPLITEGLARVARPMQWGADKDFR